MEWDIERPLIQVLCHIRERFGVEPTDYGLLQDPQVVLESAGTPRPTMGSEGQRREG